MRSFRPRTCRILCGLSLAAALALPIAAYAANFTWDGGSVVDSNWTTGPKWVGDSPPPSSLDTDILFDTSLRTTSAVGFYTLNSLTFNAGSNHTAISGSTLTFRNDSGSGSPFLAQNSATSVTISNPLSLTNSFFVGGSATSSITLAGGISGAGSLNKNGLPVLRLLGPNGYGGGTVLGGALVVGSDTALGTGGLLLNAFSFLSATGGARTLANPISMNSGGLRLFINADTLGVNDLTLNGTFTASDGALTVNTPGGTVTLGGTTANSLGGPSAVTAGTLRLNETAGLLALTGDLAIGNTSSPGADDSVVVRTMAGGQTGTATNLTVIATDFLTSRRAPLPSAS